MNYIIGTELMSLERAHLVRLGVWALASIVAGTGLIVWARRSGIPGFWRHAGIQTAAWGAVDLAIVAFAWHGLVLRDLPEAIALDRFLWLNIGLDVGYVMVGITLLVIGRRAPTRPGLMGAGAAIIVQGLALAVLDAILSGAIVRAA
ncbi:hypothetical protein Strain138_000051 [Pseudogemmatithrix spongiicola]|uniref:Uncharacterized protein n=1 Tax=Pseudogemmatithrix spongiicola TaxID=3062599 RepID=A0AA49JY37_9BACT|nr:hypothetical protein Strain138_000051 [Gemmatimonadaceae bacterium 'strain 138']WKW13728.1 hypothetical protein Strain318_000051 [Gemmatimonadaceae bacterium 'strain 318']